MKDAQEGLQLFGGSWTEKKLAILHKYLQAYSQALKNKPFERIYIDAFAGTGYREQKKLPSLPNCFHDFGEGLDESEPQTFMAGSPRIALSVTPPFHKFIFVERDPKRAHELEKLKADFPELSSGVDVRCQDANIALQEICSKWNKRTQRGVVFLDPFGLQLDWLSLEAIANTASIDTWVLFPFASNRLMPRFPADMQPQWSEKLDRLFGTHEWFDRFYHTPKKIKGFFVELDIEPHVEKRDLRLAELRAFYKERLQTIFPSVAPADCVLRGSTKNPLFQLFFAAGNERGGPIALKIANHLIRNF